MRWKPSYSSTPHRGLWYGYVGLLVLKQGQCVAYNHVGSCWTYMLASLEQSCSLSVKRDGNWGEWTPWSSCTRSCNEGTKIRRRKCDNPTPQNGGKPCKGSSRYSIICVQPRCRLGELVSYTHYYFVHGKKFKFKTQNLNKFASHIHSYNSSVFVNVKKSFF
jgi:hypothetical protein